MSLDLDILLSTRLLVTADSGGGKTVLLKRLCEQAFGKIQIIVIDPEGEFSPLRQKYDFVLVGPGGETPADVRSASMLATKLLELRASAICDIYDMKPSVRHTWVRLFLDGLIEAPKKLRHPCLVIVDEAHIFNPEHGKGESEASDSMKGLCTRGRKRLLCAVFATQRLATLSKDSSSMLLNRLIGPTFEDLNRKRAAECLSIARENQHDFMRQIQLLEPGNFYALGRAITKEMKLVRIGAIETPHGQEAIKYETSPPPPPDKVKALLPKLADLPKEAEEQARTAAQFKARIRELEATIRANMRVHESITVDTKAIERAVTESARGFGKQIVALEATVQRMQRYLTKVAGECSELAGVKLPDAPKRTAVALPIPVVPRTNVYTPWASPVDRKPLESTGNGSGRLPIGELAVLKAAAQDPEGVERKKITLLTGYRRSSRDAYISRLAAKGLVGTSGQTITATFEGMDALGSDYEPLPAEGTALRDYWLHKLPEGERRVLEVLLGAGGEAVPREVIDEATSYKRSSRDAYLSRLIARRVVEAVGRGEVKASSSLF